jgi:hypothetical protein
MSTSIRLSLCLAVSVMTLGCTNKNDDVATRTSDSRDVSASSSGVQRQAVLGTWQGRDTQGGNPAATQPAGFQFASVSFVNDGTFTAQMRYNGRLVADSGTWSLKGNTLTVQGSAGGSGAHGGSGGAHGGSGSQGGATTQGGSAAGGQGAGMAGGRPAHHGGPRTYTVQTRGDELMITDPQTRVTVTLDRMKGR